MSYGYRRKDFAAPWDWKGWVAAGCSRCWPSRSPTAVQRLASDPLCRAGRRRGAVYPGVLWSGLSRWRRGVSNGGGRHECLVQAKAIWLGREPCELERLARDCGSL